MAAHYERAWILFQQARPDQAEAELRRELALSPNFAGAHALMALCLVKREEYAAATREAEQAIALDPQMPLGYHALARVLFDRRRYEEAEDAILEAIRLNPAEADYFAELGDIRMAVRDWRGALDAAEQGLREDPEHVACNNVRASALVHLGRREEAGQTLGAALARDPDNAMTHANQGWALLHSNQPREAMNHFREALRLQPEMDWARAGIVEALKAHNPIYRLFLAYFLWMARLSGWAQWGVILGGYFGARFLTQMARNSPELRPLVYPILIIYFAFALMTWLAQPFFNLLLRLNRFGRLALSPEQITASNWLGGCLLAALVALIPGLVLGDLGLLLAAGGLAALMIPVAGIYLCPGGWPRVMMTVYTLTIALFLLAGLGLHYSGDEGIGLALCMLSGLGALLATWVANLLMMARPRR